MTKQDAIARVKAAHAYAKHEGEILSTPRTEDLEVVLEYMDSLGKRSSDIKDAIEDLMGYCNGETGMINSTFVKGYLSSVTRRTENEKD